MAGRELRLRRARRAGARLCDDDPQEPRIGVPGGGDLGHDAALYELQKDLLYTGVTRGRKLVVLVGQPKAVAMAVKSPA